MKKKNPLFLLSGVIFLVLGIGLQGCSETRPNDSGRVLVKVGNRTVTVDQYRQTFEMAVVSYPLQVLKDRQYVEGLKLMLLNQVIDELAILSRADELGLSISDEALKKEVARIQADYPDDTFDTMLLEQSISMRKWQEGLKKRLLIEKVVENDLGGSERPIFDRSPVVYAPGKDQEATVPTPETDKPETEKKPKQVTETRSDSPEAIASETTDVPDTTDVLPDKPAAKSADPYSEWISGLRDKYPIFIDEGLWEKLNKKE